MNDMEARFSVSHQMFIHEGALGKISWEPSPEVLQELRKIAATKSDAETLEERIAPSIAFEVLFKYTIETYLELLTLSLFGITSGKTKIESFQLAATLEELKDDLVRNLDSPEMANVLTIAQTSFGNVLAYN